MKYIVYKDLHQIEAVVLFGEQTPHTEIGQGLQLSKLDPKTLVSAGFCNINGDVWGYSQSLNLKSRHEDTALIRRTINFRGAQ